MQNAWLNDIHAQFWYGNLKTTCGTYAYIRRY